MREETTTLLQMDELGMDQLVNSTLTFKYGTVLVVGIEIERMKAPSQLVWLHPWNIPSHAHMLHIIKHIWAVKTPLGVFTICFKKLWKGISMLKIDIIDGEERKKAKDLWLRIWTIPFNRCSRHPIRKVKWMITHAYKKFEASQCMVI